MYSESEEEGLTQWAITLVACPEPFSDACSMELILAVLARHARQTLICRMEDTVTNEAFFDSIDFFVDVALPQEHCRYDIAISDLKKIPDGQHPLVLLPLCNLHLFSYLYLDLF